MRSTISPAFTGSKMRLMFDLLTECAKNSMKTLKEQIHESSSDALEMKELFTKFTVDIIATCAFGLEVNSFENPDNEFVKIRKVIDDFNKPQAAFKMLGFGMFPKLMEFFKLRLMDESTCEVFQATITDTIKIREERKIVRHDMINLLMQANKGQLSHDKSVEDAKEGFAMVEESVIGKAKVDRVWDDEDMAAQGTKYILLKYFDLRIFSCSFHFLFCWF